MFEVLSTATIEFLIMAALLGNEQSMGKNDL